MHVSFSHLRHSCWPCKPAERPA